MRKTIETLSTLALWTMFIVGSCLAVRDFISKSDDGQMMLAHLKLISITPVLAIIIFVSMVLAVRFSKNQNTKKTLPNEHAAQWSAEELIGAQTGKMVDLHFPSTGLACHVVARETVATVLHSENTVVHLKVVPQSTEESSMALISQSL